MRLLLATLLISGICSCQGDPSEKPPIHINPNMDLQNKYLPQAEGNFFADGMSMRTPVAGTVARGTLKESSAYFFGKDETGAFIQTTTVSATAEVIQRGKERFNIYCSPCHGEKADGAGIMSQKGFPPPPTFIAKRSVDLPDGFFYDKIANGSVIMSSYGHQVRVQDRWAIVQYIRSLQKEQNASEK